MRKSMVFIILLFALAVSALIFAHAFVDTDKDKVEITEKTIYGDISALNGVSVGCSAQYRDYLFWNTSCRFEDGLKTSTEFEFVQGGTGARLMEYEPYGIRIDLAAMDFGISANGGIEFESEQDLAVKPAIDVASRTEAGKSRTERVYVGDYYDYYPISVYIDLPSEFSVYEEEEKTKAELAQLFKVPVLPEHMLEISVRKDDNGNVINADCASLEQYLYLESMSVVTENGCYFSFNVYRNDTGGIIETESVGFPSGVYYVPYHTEEINEKKRSVLELENMETVMEIDFGESYISSFDISGDKSRLLVTTAGGGSYVMTVLDTMSGEIMQTLDILPEIAGEINRLIPHIHDGYCLYMLHDGSFALLAESADGVYELEFTADMENIGEDGWDWSYWDVVTSYDGERLVMAFGDINFMLSDFYVSAFEDGEMTYTGQFTSSLAAVGSSIQWGDYNDPLTITMKTGAESS